MVSAAPRAQQVLGQVQLGRWSHRLNHPSTPGSKYPCQQDVLWFQGDINREEGQQDRSALDGRNPAWEDGRIPSMILDVPGSSSAPGSCGRHVFTSVYSPVFFPGHCTFLCTRITCTCVVSQGFFGCRFRALPCWQQALRLELPIL